MTKVGIKVDIEGVEEIIKRNGEVIGPEWKQTLKELTEEAATNLTAATPVRTGRTKASPVKKTYQSGPVPLWGKATNSYPSAHLLETGTKARVTKSGANRGQMEAEASISGSKTRGIGPGSYVRKIMDAKITQKLGELARRIQERFNR